MWVRDEQSSVTLGDWRCVWGRDNHKGRETGAARDAGRGGEKETSIELLEQRSGTAYRWDTEIQSSVRVLRQATNPTFESYSEGDTLLDRERACLDSVGTCSYTLGSARMIRLEASGNCWACVLSRLY